MRNRLRRASEQETDIAKMPTEKRRRRFLKVFYAPLRKLGIDIKDGELHQLATEFVKAQTKDDKARADRINQQNKLKQQAQNTLETISLETGDDSDEDQP